MFYPEVEKYLKREKFHKNYCERIYACIENLRKQISTDKQMHAWLSCKDNRCEDLYNELIKQIENLIPFGNDIYDPVFEIYNIMHNQPFYNIWTNDLLRHLISNKQRK